MVSTENYMQNFFDSWCLQDILKIGSSTLRAKKYWLLLVCINCTQQKKLLSWNPVHCPTINWIFMNKEVLMERSIAKEIEKEYWNNGQCWKQFWMLACFAWSQVEIVSDLKIRNLRLTLNLFVEEMFWIIKHRIRLVVALFWDMLALLGHGSSAPA